MKRLLAAWFPSPFNRAKRRKKTSKKKKTKEEERRKEEEKKTFKNGVDDELYSLCF